MTLQITLKLSSFLLLKTPKLIPTATTTTTYLRQFSTTKSGDDEWNDAWETAWLPHNLTSKTHAPWDPPSQPSSNIPTDNMDLETKAFVEDMTENWELRKSKDKTKEEEELDNMKKDYRLKKQRVHAGLWIKEIEKMEEAKLGDSFLAGDNNIDKLLDSCSEIFDFEIELKNKNNNKPDGWETLSKCEDGGGNIWEMMSQREEDILVQEFERRIAFNKFQIASFIKTHIFSRRRPIDGWKHMIEEIGPNARKGGKGGSVSRIPTLADEATQPFRQANTLPSS